MLELSNLPAEEVKISECEAFDIDYVLFTAQGEDKGISAIFTPRGTPTNFPYVFQFLTNSSVNAQSLLLVGDNSNDKHVIASAITNSGISAYPIVFRCASNTEWNSRPDIITIAVDAIENRLTCGTVGTGIGILVAQANLHSVINTATANAVSESVRIEARVSTTSTGASAGFGPAQTFYGESSVDETYRQMGQVDFTWATATDASRKARGTFSVWDTAAREGMRIEASGSAPMIGFLGMNAVIKQTGPTSQETGYIAGLLG